MGGDAADSTQLSALGVKAVINATREEEVPNFFPSNVRYLRVAVKDRAGEPLLLHLSDAISFIADAQKHSEVVLVHCVWGVSRSTAICMAWLMSSQGLSVEEAAAKVKAARPCVKPNEDFLSQ